MSERYKLPKESWYVPFGPVRGVDLIRVSVLIKHRERNGATCSHGTLLTRLEISFEKARRVTSQLHEQHENCEYFLNGRTGSIAAADKPGMLFVVRDGAIIVVKPTHRMDWEEVA